MHEDYISNSFNIFFSNKLKIYYIAVYLYLLFLQKSVTKIDIFFIMSCYTSSNKTMEININCDLGEKSKLHSNIHDQIYLNSKLSNIACAFGDDHQ